MKKLKSRSSKYGKYKSEDVDWSKKSRNLEYEFKKRNLETKIQAGLENKI